MSAIYAATLLTEREVLWRCRQCDWHSVCDRDERPFHACDGQLPLGDAIEKLLESWGFSRTPDCRCAKRIAWLNRFSEFLPWWAKAFAGKLLSALIRS